MSAALIKANQRAFTLVEVLVTMAIFALIGIASFTVLDQMAKTEQQSKQAREQLQQLQFGLLMMQQDIRQAVIKPTRPRGVEVVHQYITNDADFADSDSGLLALVKSGYDNPGLLLPRAELQPVIYRVQDETLQRLSFAYVNDRSDQPVVQDLLQGVQSLQVRFYRQSQQAEANQGLNEGWQGSWQTRGDLPAAVEVTLQTRAFGEIQRVLLTTGSTTDLAATDE